MNNKQIFVGRQEELKEFKKVLENPKGQAVIVVGPKGRGKTWLVNRMAQIAGEHQELKCGCVRYEATPTDAVDSIMALMMDKAYEAAQITEGSFAGTERRLEQWRAFLNVFNIGDLAMSLRRDPAKDTRQQFVDRLNLVSRKMPENGRAIFIIDPEKYMQEKSDYAWGIIIRQLPPKIKFLFPQRLDDVLVKGEGLNGIECVVRIPETELQPFDEKTAEKVVDKNLPTETKQVISELKERVRESDLEPYTIGGLTKLIAGTSLKVDELVKYLKQEDVARLEWLAICSKEKEAKQLFEAYAILEVGVPEDVVMAVSGLNSTTIKRLQADSYLKGLLRDEGEGKRIYHSILTDYILEQMNDEEKKKYHLRAAKIYRGKLKKAEEEQIKPDELAATRLAEHVLAAEGQDAFVKIFINECSKPLHAIGALDTYISLSERALTMVKENSEEQVALLGNLGLIYQTHGDLDKAEEMCNKVLEIEKNLGRPGSIAHAYSNLGIIYKTRGELDKAEEMHKKSLAINEKLGHLKGMASNYGNLGIVYQTRGELDKAEEMYKKVLAINEKLGWLEGMVNSYGNLGIVYTMRGDLTKAEEMYNKVLYIEEKLGRPDSIAKAFGNLGIIYYTRGDLDEAEKMYKKALAINEKLGWLEGIAANYSNLGLIYEKRGNLDKAKEYWVKARDMYEKIGMPHKVKEMQGWITAAEGGGVKN